MNAKCGKRIRMIARRSAIKIIALHHSTNIVAMLYSIFKFLGLPPSQRGENERKLFES
jgi:hypothetical protein